MNTRNIVITKLISGETIIGEVEQFTDYITVYNPYVLSMIMSSSGTLKQVMVPWMDSCDDAIYSIENDKIITKGIPSKEMISIYNNQKNVENMLDEELKEIRTKLVKNTKQLIH